MCVQCQCYASYKMGYLDGYLFGMRWKSKKGGADGPESIAQQAQQKMR